MRIFYGTAEKNIDVTEICFAKLFNSEKNLISIPAGDEERTYFFTDPVYGSLKNIFIMIDSVIKEYGFNEIVKIQMKKVNNSINNEVSITISSDKDICDKLVPIQKNLKINFGSFYEELPEQKMAAKYLKGDERVLEIGGNIGRNSLIISSILQERLGGQLVVMECDNNIARQLEENRNINNKQFHIETAALSKRKLIQRGWQTMVLEEGSIVDNDWKKVNTITLDELTAKYNIHFDTLVLDCEGAFYYILMDMPEIIKNIKTIIVENDYKNPEHKRWVDDVLRENKFRLDYAEDGGWMYFTDASNFYEVWIR